jgi:2-methylcitrate dehydratase PrpD
MGENYARLCARFVASRALIAGDVVSEDFTPVGRCDSATLDLAYRVDIKNNHNSDPNALSPIQLEIEDTSGSVSKITIDTVYGHPSKPMNRDAWLAKFRNNWRRSITPLTESACERVIERINALASLEDAAMIVDDLVP